MVGKLVEELGAGGFAFACTNETFSNARGETVELKINDFELQLTEKLLGVIIRSSNNAGTYIVGCRLLEDNKQIAKYVEKKMQ